MQKLMSEVSTMAVAQFLAGQGGGKTPQMVMELIKSGAIPPELVTQAKRRIATLGRWSPTMPYSVEESYEFDDSLLDAAASDDTE